MEIKQLKLNGTAFYPKVGIDSIVNADGTESAVDTVVTENSVNLVTSGAVYDAIQEGGGEIVAWEDVTGKPDFKAVATSGSYIDLTNKPIIPTKTSDLTNDSSFVNESQLSGKQDALVSGTNIKTINNQSILGPGNIDIQGGGSGSVNSVSYSNNAGDFEPDQSGKITLTIDQTLDADSGRPVTNAAIKTKFDSVVDKVAYSNNAGEFTPTNGKVTLTVDQTLNADSGRPVTNAAIATKFDSVDTAIGSCVKTIEVSNHKLKYTTSGSVTPVEVATIDTVATKNSTNLVTSGAVLNSVGDSFGSKNKYFKGLGLSSVESVFDIQGQLIDTVGNTRIGYIEFTIEWFNAKCDAGETDRLVKKHYAVGKEPVIIENSQWDPSGIISDINSYPGNQTDFAIYSQPSFTYSSSGGRMNVQIHLGLGSSKYQVHSITITKVYDPNNVELQIADAFQSTAQYSYSYTNSPQPGIYVIEGEVILRTNNNWYKIGDAEESPMKPNT